ncbi:VOC family protein [Marinicella sp. W31]|uniref:VOC family protein n=1 Tax=Marinicella sp. W31 TaxID=3023713 RepID=UPI00375632C1
MTEIRYAHTNIISTHWKRLVAFYTDTFQCQTVPPKRKQSGDWLAQGTGVSNATLEGVHLRLPGHGPNSPTLEIYQYQETLDQAALQPNHRGFGHIAFEVSNLQQVVDTLLANGGSLCGQITHKKVPGVGNLSFVYARDPDGNIIELQTWSKEQ